ncbi:MULTISPECIES: PIN/TRAM domain-containing protein [unclassified Clostridium]|uniref:PIN/TRAM domain-containing protein n=1 Tax=unclassified Clostridium TaxID=2614128 RepID=UPI000297EEC7|nr:MULTISPECIES: PIN/TRAM domain-containing protein [unclassified Clostridium]EKQ52123.1 MAG: integral membrane protein (PIN domain superfamily) [Clostridium sp. Maddingley MBC34-26]
MLKKILRGIFSVIGLIIGYFISDILLTIPQISGLTYLSTTITRIAFFIVVSLIFGLILYIISPLIYKGISNLIEYIEKSMQKMSITEIIYGTIGAIITLILMTFIAKPINDISVIGPILLILLNILAAIIGAEIMIKKKEDITALLVNIKRPAIREKKVKETVKESTAGIPKVLDTSVIIDGRIFDICETGFIEGPLVIPNFVLDELRHISDSSDSLKRNRGRRGLDILNKIQKELSIETQIVDDDFPKIAEVDAKLLKLAQKMEGKVITNDYNLNKVAEFQGVPVLNINELSNAIKPVVLPGEEMIIDIVKDGKESSQGVAYLEDGTMIVVEGGRKYIGQTTDVIVTSVLQTAAGRMIFAKPKDN